MGCSLLSLVVTAMAVAPPVPLPLLENTNASSGPVNTNWTVAALAGIYINCAKMVLVSTIVYAVFAAYSRILESNEG